MAYQKKKNGNGLFVAICVALVFMFAAGALGWLSGGFRDWSVKSWFNSLEQSKNENEGDTENGDEVNWAAYSEETEHSVFLITVTETSGINETDALEQVFYGNKNDASTLKLVVKGIEDYVKEYTASASGNFNIPFTLPKTGDYVIETWISSGAGEYGFGNGTLVKTVFAGDVQSKRDILTECFIGSRVPNIGAYAFYGYHNLTTVIMPAGVTEINPNAFAQCHSLSTVVLPDGMTDIGGAAFAGCSGLEDITIPESVTGIKGNAFNSCYGLKSVVIPKNVTVINDYTFYRCYNLTDVELPESITDIGQQAFNECYELTSVTLYGGVPPGLGFYVFGAINSAAKIYVPDGKVEVYKTDGKWSVYADYIYPISDK